MTEDLYFSGGKSQTASSLADDQLATDVSIRALFNNYRHKTPLVLLVDDKYALFPYNLSSSNITYAVLGFYWITRFWRKCFIVFVVTVLGLRGMTCSRVSIHYY